MNTIFEMKPCKLCLKKRVLKNSHIIPEFIYSSIYDEKHRLAIISNKGTMYAEQKGLREYLLCGDCEATLSKYERYISLNFVNQLENSNLNDELLLMEGLDYKQFRLFAVSILWRASVSSLYMFKYVQLGSKHEEILRQMIFNAEPGKPDQYSFTLSLVKNGDKVGTDRIMQPTWIKIDNHRGYYFVFGGLVWDFIVSSHKPPAWFVKKTISEEGIIPILIEDMKDMHFINDFMSELVRNNKLPPIE